MGGNKGFDLKSFRVEKLKISQVRFAEILDTNQETISRYESNPRNITVDFLMKISEKFGVSFDQLLRYEKEVPDELDVSNTWKGMNYIRNTTLAKLEKGASEKDIQNSICLQKIDEIRNSVLVYTAKPKVVFVGRSDSGKSTMINALIGAEKMPTNWTPTTAAVVYIKHIDDRPDYIKNELLILGRDENGREWDDARLGDEAYTSSLKLADGDASLLSSYATSNGEKFLELKDEISAAVLFVDSKVLKNCDILDVPGFAGGRNDDNLAAANASLKADVLVYLSQVNSFMGIEDFVYLKNAIENLTYLEQDDENAAPIFRNLFVVATQAHIVETMKTEVQGEVIDKILTDGCHRFFEMLGEEFWEYRKQVGLYCCGEEELRSRFFSYTTDSREMRADFENEFKSIIEEIPRKLKKVAKEKIMEIAENAKKDLSEIRDELQSKNEKYIDDSEILRAFEKNYEENRNELELCKGDMLKEIRKYKKITLQKFAKEYSEVINEYDLIKRMERMELSNYKKERSRFLGRVSSVLEIRCRKIIKENSEKIKDEIKEYLDSCEKLLEIPFLKFESVFALGISNPSVASAMGAISTWVLYGAARVALARTSVGMLLRAGAGKALLAVGGPIGFGVSVVASVASMAVAIFGGGWKKQFAKTICNEYEREKVLDKYNEAIECYWDDTAKAFAVGADKVIEEYARLRENLEHNVSEWNKENLEKTGDLTKTLNVIGSLF